MIAALLGFLVIWVVKTAAQTGESLGSRAFQARVLLWLCTVAIAIGLTVWSNAYHVMLSDWLDRQITVATIEQRLGSTCTISDAFVRHAETATDRATNQGILLQVATLVLWFLLIVPTSGHRIYKILRERRAQGRQ
jgi:hypothetical protein